MVGLDVTNLAACTPALMDENGQKTPGSEAGKVVQESLAKMYDFFFDPVTAALLIDPSIVTTERMGIRVETTGKTQEDADGAPIDVGLGPGFDRFLKILLGAINPSN